MIVFGSPALAEEAETPSEPPEPPVEEPLVESVENVCDGVTCSGNGTCRDIEGRPACACEPGFEPDQNGLNCTRIHQQPESSAENQSPELEENRETSLPEAPLFISMLTFYWLGIAAEIAGLALIPSWEDQCGCSWTSAYPASIGLFAGGATFVLVGSILQLVRELKIRKARTRPEADPDEESRDLAFAPLIAPTRDGGILGFSGYF